jgi:hypothetical protein
MRTYHSIDYLRKTIELQKVPHDILLETGDEISKFLDLLKQNNAVLSNPSGNWKKVTSLEYNIVTGEVRLSYDNS